MGSESSAVSRVVLIGWGAIGRTVGRLLADSPVRIAAVAVRDRTVERLDLPPGVEVIGDPSELGALAPDVVAEAAGRDTVVPWGDAALRAGADVVVSSVSAFADASVLDALRKTAATTGRRIEIQPGAVAGIEALAAARELGIDDVEHRMVKPPRAWLGTPAETLCDLHALSEPEAFHRASAADTAAAFPKNANVAMTTALAGIGPDRTRITLVADPHSTRNRHEIQAHGAFGELTVTIANAPLPDNPKTSALAALSLVRCLKNRSATLVI